MALTDTDGRILVAHPSGPLAPASRRLVRITHASGRSKTVVKRRGGSHPTYEIVMVLKDGVPQQVQKYMARLIGQLPPTNVRVGSPLWGPTRSFSGR